MEEKQAKTQNLRLIIVMFIIPWLCVGGNTVMTVLPSLASSLNISDQMIKYVGTISNLAVIPASIIGGLFVGKVIKFKTQLLISTVILIIAGTMPFFLNSFVSILITRVFFGLGFGMMSPISNGLAFKLFDGEARTRVLGLSLTAVFFSAVCYTLIGGALCEISWRYAFLVHLLGIIPMVLTAVMLPDVPRLPREKIKEKSTDKPEKSIKAIMPKAFWFLLLSFAFQMFIFPIVVNTPFIVAENNFGSATISSIVLSTYTIAGAVASFLFAYAESKIRRYTLPFSLMLCVVGVAAMYFSVNLPMLMAGMTAAGMGGAMMNVAVILEVGGFIPKENIAAYSGINMAAGSIGGFCVNGFLSLLTKMGFVTAQSPLIVSSLGIALLTCATLIYIITSNRRRIKNGGILNKVEG